MGTYMVQGGGVFNSANKSPSVNEEKLKAYFEKKGHQGNQFNNLNHVKQAARKKAEDSGSKQNMASTVSDAMGEPSYKQRVDTKMLDTNYSAREIEEEEDLQSI